jgi:hypothetical protein
MRRVCLFCVITAILLLLVACPEGGGGSGHHDDVEERTEIIGFEVAQRFFNSYEEDGYRVSGSIIRRFVLLGDTVLGLFDDRPVDQYDITKRGEFNVFEVHSMQFYEELVLHALDIDEQVCTSYTIIAIRPNGNTTAEIDLCAVRHDVFTFTIEAFIDGLRADDDIVRIRELSVDLFRFTVFLDRIDFFGDASRLILGADFQSPIARFSAVDNIKLSGEFFVEDFF